MIHQTELSECGLACLAMVACAHGHDVDLPGLRRRFSSSVRGASLPCLIEVAQRLGLESRPLRVELEYLRELRTPCILHWGLNHFVVLRRARRNSIEIHDPARGVVRLDLSEVSAKFTGIALELSPSADFRPICERRRITLRALAGKVHGLKRAVGLVLLLALALELFTLLLPLAMQWVLDHVLVTADLDLLTLLGIGFLTVVVFQALTMAMRGWVVADIGASMSAQWITNLFGHLLRLPLAFFEKREVGSITSRFTSLHTIRQTLTGSFIETGLDGMTVVLVLAILFTYDPGLTAVVLASFAIYSAARTVMYRHLWRLNEEQLVHSARQESRIIESVRGMQAIKLAGMEGERRARVENAAVEVANRQARIQKVSSTLSAFSTLVFGVQRVVLIWLGAYLTIGGQFTAGMLVVFVTYAEMFSNRASTLVDRLVDLRLLGLHGQRIADIALEPPEGRDDAMRPTPTIRSCDIEVQDLGFRYSDDDPWVLRGCSFRVREGESIAIVGESGCGKSTLAKLLLGLLEPSEGSIRVGGIELERFGHRAYRSMFGAVMQNDDLFAGTIADNISFFDHAGDQSAIEAAARVACIHDDIAAMPMGYETAVGDMGSTLSGGQKQRLLLARALYRHPRILLLDEATSHLDLAREHQVNSQVGRLNITRIVIAHRPDTIASACRVIEIRAGRVHETEALAHIAAMRASNTELGDSPPALAGWVKNPA